MLSPINIYICLLSIKGVSDSGAEEGEHSEQLRSRREKRDNLAAKGGKKHRSAVFWGWPTSRKRQKQFNKRKYWPYKSMLARHVFLTNRSNYVENKIGLTCGYYIHCFTDTKYFTDFILPIVKLDIMSNSDNCTIRQYTSWNKNLTYSVHLLSQKTFFFL